MKLSYALLENLAKRTIEYLNNDLSIKDVEKKFEILNVDKLDLLDISAMIALSGSLKGTVSLSVSNNMAYKMVENFIYGEMKKDELEELAGENVAEILNIVLGNILAQLNNPAQGVHIDISTPYTLHNSVSITKKKDGTIYFCELKYKNDKILLSYFI